MKDTNPKYFNFVICTTVHNDDIDQDEEVYEIYEPWCTHDLDYEFRRICKKLKLDCNPDASDLDSYATYKGLSCAYSWYEILRAVASEFTLENCENPDLPGMISWDKVIKGIESFFEKNKELPSKYKKALIAFVDSLMNDLQDLEGEENVFVLSTHANPQIVLI